MLLPASLLTLASPALAAASNPVDGNPGFLVLTEGNATLTSNETEGPLGIGGNLTVNGAYTISGPVGGAYTDTGDSVGVGLYVGGTLVTGGSNHVNVNNLYVKVRDHTNLNFSGNLDIGTNPAGTFTSRGYIHGNSNQTSTQVTPQKTFDFTSIFNTYRGRSTQLATCVNTVVLRNANNDANIPFPITPGTQGYIQSLAAGTNVLNLSKDDLNNLASITFNAKPSSSSPLLINVKTDYASSNGAGGVNEFLWQTRNMAGIGNTEAPYILFNFPTATSITQVDTSASSIEGTIYAPRATFTDNSGGNNEGNIISTSYAQTSGEAHDFPFLGMLSCGDEPPPPVVTPSLSTLATASVSVGGSISDSATLSGGSEPTGTMSFVLYSDAECSVEVAGYSSVKTVSGNGVYVSDGYAPSVAGTYYWVASYSGDAKNEAVSGECGDADETSVVTAAEKVTPSLSTLATASVSVGGSISDSATLSGGSEPTGTMSFVLYSDAECSVEVAGYSSVKTVSGNGVYVSDGYAPSVAGTYYWVASYSGDAKNEAVSGECGDADETSVVEDKGTGHHDGDDHSWGGGHLPVSGTAILTATGWALLSVGTGVVLFVAARRRRRLI